MNDWIEPIAEIYVKRAGMESDIKAHLPRLKVLVEQLMPINIIELGTRQGYSTVAFLTAIRTRPHAHLYSVDLEPVYGEMEEWVDQIDQWTFIQSSDIPYPKGLPHFADMIFVDTSYQRRDSHLLRAYIRRRCFAFSRYRHLARIWCKTGPPRISISKSCLESVLLGGFQWPRSALSSTG